ncbi:MAG: signal peptide peptidase SppA [Paramuribaculum sp.]|nr:signal peptide peptidase SppA [Paramuribaculum sp.]
MKRFFSVFLGSMAAIWVSIILGGVLLLLTFMAIGMSNFTSSKTAEIRKHSVLKIELSGEIVERQMPLDLFEKLSDNSQVTTALDELLAVIDNAANEKNIEGIVLDCKDVSVGLAQSQAIRQALLKFKESGKWIYSYGDNYSQIDYYIASVADSIFINPIGMVDIHGLMATNIYFKDLLDKLGIDVQVVKVGTFKSAVEPFILNESSEANRKQQEHYLNSFWSVIKQEIAKKRGVSETEIDSWANGYIFSDSVGSYIDNHIVDNMLYRRQFNELVVRSSGLKADDLPRYVSVQNYINAKNPLDSKKRGMEIAVLYAVGDITESDDGGIASDRLVPQILELAEKDEIDGLILRINSGGGSAFASEQIWEALEQFKQKTKKPFYVSMSDVAASGGYYIACGADKIYADPLTITGSIGIFGLIPDVHKLLNDKLGVHTSVVSTNQGHFPSFFNAMSPGQREAMQDYVNRGYELFVKRVAEGRKMSVDSVKSIAEGRVWDGITASRIGLVDKLGSLELAISDMAKEIGAADKYYIESYPKIKPQWWEPFFSMDYDMEGKYIRSKLGRFAPFYDAATKLSDLDPLQCRMDYVIIR